MSVTDKRAADSVVENGSRNSQPLVTVVIVTRNRHCDLDTAIMSATAQKYNEIEFIVYDDASEPPARPIVEAYAPRVGYTRVETQVGPTELRARAHREACGKYVVFLDDDAFFTSPQTISRAVERLEADESIAVLALPLIEPDRSPNGSMRRSPDGRLRSFLGGSAVVRRDALRTIGGVRDCYRFLGGEEKDVAIRVLDAGYTIQYADTPPVVHVVSPRRDDRFKFHYDVRSALLFDWLNVPFPYLVPTLVRHSLQLLTYRLTLRNAWSRLIAVSSALAACVGAWRMRQPVSLATYRLYRSLPPHGVEASRGQSLLPAKAETPGPMSAADWPTCPIHEAPGE